MLSRIVRPDEYPRPAKRRGAIAEGLPFHNIARRFDLARSKPVAKSCSAAWRTCSSLPALSPG